ncbi:hypothetical protein MHBO_000473 [Bonamia ostreae]|uniref:60S ribosomal protein L35a n=1 Tax=Bonamia ostreae TaxID=126728 RepID=A0ABV2AFS1_9EUKA
MSRSDKTKKTRKTKQKRVFKKPTRLYCHGVFLGYKRSRRVQNMNIALIEIDGLKTRKDVDFYIGKKIAYVYKGDKNGDKREMVGKVMRPHGNSGVVRAKFVKNLPAKAIGERVRVYLYPSNI